MKLALRRYHDRKHLYKLILDFYLRNFGNSEEFYRCCVVNWPPLEHLSRKTPVKKFFDHEKKNLDASVLIIQELVSKFLNLKTFPCNKLVNLKNSFKRQF